MLTSGIVEFVFEYVPGLAASQDGTDDEDEDENEESEVPTPPPPHLVPLPPHTSHAPIDVPFVDVSVATIVSSPVRLHDPPVHHNTVAVSEATECLWLPGHDPSGPSSEDTGSSAAGYSSRSVSLILTPATASAHLTSPHHLLRRHWPLENKHEAELLHHFVTDLSSWVRV